MEVTIDVEAYMGTATTREIIEEELRNAVRTRLARPGEFDRILSNISYYAVFQEIDAAVLDGGDTLRNQIRDRAYEHLNKGGGYGVFRSKDRWSDASEATKIVEEFVREKRDLIEERVHQAITQMPLAEVKNEILYVLHDRIDNILAGIEG